MREREKIFCTYSGPRATEAIPPLKIYIPPGKVILVISHILTYKKLNRTGKIFTRALLAAPIFPNSSWGTQEICIAIRIEAAYGTKQVIGIAVKEIVIKTNLYLIFKKNQIGKIKFDDRDF